jgi:hypothetical protein
MFGKFFIAIAPFAITAARIVASDPALRNFVIGAVTGNTPSTSKATPVRPHADATAFCACPACRGTGLVPVYETKMANGHVDWDHYTEKYPPKPAPAH